MNRAKRLRDQLLNSSKEAATSSRAATPGIAHQSGITWLPVSDIAPDESQPRTYYGQSDIEKLAESIRTIGQVEPILVQPLRSDEQEVQGGRRFRCISGHRRLRAHELLGLTEIKATILRESLSPTERLTREIASNEVRADHTDFERATFFVTLLCDELGVTEESAETADSPKGEPIETLRQLVNRAFNEFDRKGEFSPESKEIVDRCELALKRIGERRNLRWFHRWGLPLLSLEGAARDAAVAGLDARRVLTIAQVGKPSKGGKALGKRQREWLIEAIVERVEATLLSHRELGAAVRGIMSRTQDERLSNRELQAILDRVLPSAESAPAKSPPSRGKAKGQSEDSNLELLERTRVVAERWREWTSKTGTETGESILIETLRTILDTNPSQATRLVRQLEDLDARLRASFDVKS